MKNITITKPINLILVLLWCLLIFGLSHQPAGKSNELSTGVTEVVIKAVQRIIPHAEVGIQALNHAVRKNAHFLAYLVLGILVSSVFKENQKKYLKWILLFCIVYAVTDELHQTFVPGRAGRITDVLIDSSGSLVGILLYSWWNLKRWIS